MMTKKKRKKEEKKECKNPPAKPLSGKLVKPTSHTLQTRSQTTGSILNALCGAPARPSRRASRANPRRLRSAQGRAARRGAPRGPPRAVGVRARSVTLLLAAAAAAAARRLWPHLAAPRGPAAAAAAAGHVDGHRGRGAAKPNELAHGGAVAGLCWQGRRARSSRSRHPAGPPALASLPRSPLPPRPGPLSSARTCSSRPMGKRVGSTESPCTKR